MEPITTELREFVANKIPVFYEMLHDEFSRLCDSIDAVHAQLERDYATACEVNERQDAEYAALKRMPVIANASIAVTPCIDWTRMADELDAFAATVRDMAGDAE